MLIDEWSAIVTNYLVGMPNLQMIFSLINLATIEPVAFRKASASTHFVKYLVATRIQILPFEAEWMGPIKFSP